MTDGPTDLLTDRVKEEVDYRDVPCLMELPSINRNIRLTHEVATEEVKLTWRNKKDLPDVGERDHKRDKNKGPKVGHLLGQYPTLPYPNHAISLF